MRGFWQSYKRLPRRHKIALGIFGMVIGLSGPTLMDKFTSFLNKVCVNLSIVGLGWWLLYHRYSMYI